jgi:hypothetical protein
MSSNNATSLVPILYGTNYRQWAVAMKALIMSTGMWAYVQGNIERESLPDKKEEREKLSETRKNEILAAQAAWDKEDGMVLGQIMLRLSPTVQQNHTTYYTSFVLWNALEGSYGKAMASTVFRDFKECLHVRISTTADPNIYFDKMFGAFARMKAADVEIPPQLQAMIALAALPHKWEMLISVVTGDVEMADLDLGEVCTAVITQFQADSVHHGSNKHNANKISAVKRKRGDPNWHSQQGSNQQQRQNQQQQGQDGQYKRKHGKRAGKGKGKQQDQSQQHSHIANVASMAPPSTSTIALPAPSGMQKRTVSHQENLFC